jgi:hypothetical protein
VGCDPGAVAFWFCSGHSALSLAGFIGPNFPINRRRRPNAEIRSRSERVRFVHSPPLRLQKRLRLRKSELDKKTMFFFEITCIKKRDPTSSFQSHSGVVRERALVHKSTPIRQFQRAGGNRGH